MCGEWAVSGARVMREWRVESYLPSMMSVVHAMCRYVYAVCMETPVALAPDIHTHTHTRAYTHTHTRIHTHLVTHTHTRAHAHGRTRTRAYTHTHGRTHTGAHAHAHARARYFTQHFTHATMYGERKLSTLTSECD